MVSSSFLFLTNLSSSCVINYPPSWSCFYSELLQKCTGVCTVLSTIKCHVLLCCYINALSSTWTTMLQPIVCQPHTDPKCLFFHKSKNFTTEIFEFCYINALFLVHIHGPTNCLPTQNFSFPIKVGFQILQLKYLSFVT